jgi:hypothetical protein
MIEDRARTARLMGNLLALPADTYGVAEGLA